VNDAKKQAYIRIGIMVALLLLSAFMVFYVKNIWFKIPFVIISAALVVFLGRLYISYKRKKYKKICLADDFYKLFLQ